jgi:hypothetical protein
MIFLCSSNCELLFPNREEYFFLLCCVFLLGVLGKRPLGRPRRRWIDNIKMNFLKIALSVVDLIGLAQDRYSGELL